MHMVWHHLERDHFPSPRLGVRACTWGRPIQQRYIFGVYSASCRPVGRRAIHPGAQPPGFPPLAV